MASSWGYRISWAVIYFGPALILVGQKTSDLYVEIRVCAKRTRLCVVYEKNINSYLQLILRARVVP